jgi:uncharacterized protein YbjT (DUF2867 family)
MDLITPPRIAVLGASGLIGQGVAEDLMRSGFPVLAVARRFTSAQSEAFGDAAVEAPFVAFDVDQLARLFVERKVEIVLNCVGVLQDGPRGRTSDVHAGFAARLVAALRAQPRPVLMLHISIPGGGETDGTAFSRSKRDAEAVIAGSGLAYAILRPGFVIAPAAFGGSALLRALAALPFSLDAATEGRPFATTAIGDIAATVEAAARLWRDGWQGGGAWDVMACDSHSVGEVIAAIRARLGGPRPTVRLPAWLMNLGALTGDLAARLGWSPPIRTTALKELRRGVTGEPAGWSAATGIEPASLGAALAAVPASVQEIWFARLYLAKPLVIGGLALFWLVSGAIALGPGYRAAVAVLTARSVAPEWAAALTVSTALADVSVGLGIAFRRSCRPALFAGLALALGYLAAASVIAPQLWADPLGPLVKIGPVLALMLVALAILPER